VTFDGFEGFPGSGVQEAELPEFARSHLGLLRPGFPGGGREGFELEVGERDSHQTLM